MTYGVYKMKIYIHKHSVEFSCIYSYSFFELQQNKKIASWDIAGEYPIL